MPVFHKFYHSSAGGLSSGSLRATGPVLNVEVEVPQALAELLASEGKQLPKPQTGVALIDTGAALTCVDAAAIAALGVTPLSSTLLQTAGGWTTAYRYPVRLNFPSEGIDREFTSVVGVDLTGYDVPLLEPAPLLVLIGRDVLEEWVFIYAGSGGFFCLAI